MFVLTLDALMSRMSEKLLVGHNVGGGDDECDGVKWDVGQVDGGQIEDVDVKLDVRTVAAGT